MALYELKKIIATNDNKGNLIYEFSAILNLKYGILNLNETHMCEIINVVGYSEITFQINTESKLINAFDFHMQFSSNFSKMNFNKENNQLTIIDISPRVGSYILTVTPIL